MGYYIEVPGPNEKAQQLMRFYGAEEVPEPSYPNYWDDVPNDKVLICVVQNGLFDAAAIVYNEREYDVFLHDTTGRPRRWLLMDKGKVFELNPRVIGAMEANAH